MQKDVRSIDGSAGVSESGDPASKGKVMAAAKDEGREASSAELDAGDPSGGAGAQSADAEGAKLGGADVNVDAARAFAGNLLARHALIAEDLPRVGELFAMNELLRSEDLSMLLDNMMAKFKRLKSLAEEGVYVDHDLDTLLGYVERLKVRQGAFARPDFPCRPRARHHLSAHVRLLAHAVLAFI